MSGTSRTGAAGLTGNRAMTETNGSVILCNRVNDPHSHTIVKTASVLYQHPSVYQTRMSSAHGTAEVEQPAWKGSRCGICLDSFLYSRHKGDVKWTAVEINTCHRHGGRRLPRLSKGLRNLIVNGRDRSLAPELDNPNTRTDLLEAICQYGCRELSAFQLCIYKNNVEMAKSIIDHHTEEKKKKKFIEKQLQPTVIVAESGGCNLYTDETILHVATINAAKKYASSDAEMGIDDTALKYLVKDLLIDCLRPEASDLKDKLNPIASGKFFTRLVIRNNETKQNHLNAGITPIQMAVCLMSVPVVKFLIENSSRLTLLQFADNPDKASNNIFHRLAMQKPRGHSDDEKAAHRERLHGMFKFLMDTPGLEEMKLLDQRNEQHYKPIHVAAHHGNTEAFKLLVSAASVMTEIHDYGVTTLNAYKLTDLDSISTGSYLTVNVLDVVVSSSEPESWTVLDVPCIRQLVDLKWKKYGSVGFTYMFCLNIIFVALLSVVIVHRPLSCSGPGDEGNASSTTASSSTQSCFPMVTTPFKDTFQTTRDFIRLAGELIVIFLAGVHLLSEIKDIVKVRGMSPDTSYCWGRFRDGSIGRSLVFTVIKWTYLLLVFVAVVLRITDAHYQDVVLAFLAFLAYLYSFVYARDFKFAGPYLISIYNICTTVLTKFVIIYIFTILTFGIFFVIMFQEASPQPPDTYAEYASVIFELFRSTLGLADLENGSITTAKLAWLVAIFSVLFLIFSVLLLVNFLVALMNGEQERALDAAKHIWQRQVVASLFMTERRVPSWLPWYKMDRVGLSVRDLFGDVGDVDDDAVDDLTRYICVHE